MRYHLLDLLIKRHCSAADHDVGASSARILFGASVQGELFAFGQDIRVLHARICLPHLLAGSSKRCFEDVPDGLPCAPVELNEPQVLDRTEIPRAGANLDAGQQDGALIVL